MLLNGGALSTRLTIAAAFMVLSGLTIHQARGMLEMHFSIFVLLALLLYYRDWIPIVFAAAVIAVHHLAFDYMQRQGLPVWVFAANTGFIIVVIHALFVVAETAVLVIMARSLQKEVEMVGANPGRLISVARRLAEGESADLASLGRVPADSIADAITRSARAIEGTLSEVDSVLGQIARGDFSQRIVLTTSVAATPRSRSPSTTPASSSTTCSAQPPVLPASSLQAISACGWK